SAGSGRPDMRPRLRRALGIMAAAGLAVLPWAVRAGAAGAAPLADPGQLFGSPVKPVVVLYQGNPLFHDILGALGVKENNRCLGTTTGEISDGTQVALTAESDIPPEVGHKTADQETAINGGLMNGWDRVFGCQAFLHYACLTQAKAGLIPTVWSLADTYAVSDLNLD